MAFFGPEVICSNTVQFVAGANLYHFGILTSHMHMAWTRVICGRLESRYRYSKDIVYNNFPWPEATEAQQDSLAKLAQVVLDVRDLYPNENLAKLYDPVGMPVELVRAHEAIDRFVDRLYQRKPFSTDVDRAALLFKKYEALAGSS